MLFGVISGINKGEMYLMEVHMHQKERAVPRVFCPIGLNVF